MPVLSSFGMKTPKDAGKSNRVTLPLFVARLPLEMACNNQEPWIEIVTSFMESVLEEHHQSLLLLKNSPSGESATQLESSPSGESASQSKNSPGESGSQSENLPLGESTCQSENSPSRGSASQSENSPSEESTSQLENPLPEESSNQSENSPCGESAGQMKNHPSGKSGRELWEEARESRKFVVENLVKEYKNINKSKDSEEKRHITDFIKGICVLLIKYGAKCSNDTQKTMVRLNMIKNFDSIKVKHVYT